ncbi:unnamed protein product, partial [Strongylus vulgaris]
MLISKFCKITSCHKLLPADKEPTTSELPPTTTRAASTTASNDLSTTTIDEDAEPFDLEKLSGVFEQDGSFIPDHLVNQPSVEPVFPRVELPEESTELIGGDQRAKQTTTTSTTSSISSSSTTEQPTFVLDSKPTTVLVDFHQDQATSTAAPKADLPFNPQLHPIVIQPIVTKTTINEVFQISRQPGIDSDDGPRLVPVQHTEILPKQEETSTSSQSVTQEVITTPLTHTEEEQTVAPTTSTTSTAVPVQFPVFEHIPQPEPGPRPEPAPQPEPEPSSESRPQPAVPQPEPEPQPQPEAPLQPQPQPEPQPEPVV